MATETERMRPKILLIYHTVTFPVRFSILDHIGSFRRYADADCIYYNTRSGTLPAWLAQCPFDLIIFDTTFLSERWTPWAFHEAVAKVRALKHNRAKKVALPQDEFLQCQLLCDFINEFEVDVVYSLCPEQDWPNVYRWCDHNRVVFKRKLAGYVDARTSPRTSAFADAQKLRPIDIGYRAWGAQPWLGRHGQLKVKIAEAFASAMPADLRADISTRDDDMFVGDAWYQFLAGCRCVLGVEGGASLLDLDGSARYASDAYLSAKPSASFDEIERSCFPGRDGSLNLRVITPRHFEAAMTRTCQVLVRGAYNGLLQANKDYIAVDPDFGNLSDVIAQVRNEELCRERAENAWQALISSDKYTYATFVSELVDHAICGAAIRSRGRTDEDWAATAHRARLIESQTWQDLKTYWADRMPAQQADHDELEEFLSAGRSATWFSRSERVPTVSVSDRNGSPFDSVYFFMWQGWRKETESNRWHYGRRWARTIPLTMIQPELPQHAGWRVEPEVRIPKAEILSVVESSWAVEDMLLTGLRQARQIAEHIKVRGYRRPLFWGYNCSMIFAYLIIPAVYRVFHGTENYFDFPNLSDPWLHLQRSAIDASDTVICCSSGVLKAFESETGRRDMLLVNNGCDYHRYSNKVRPASCGTWVERVQALVEQGHPIVVFAGSLDTRTDWQLLFRLCEQFKGRIFLFAGLIKRSDLSEAEKALVDRLLAYPNVIHLGVLHPDEVAYLYSFCDLGIIPYLKLGYLVNNGFPLKALEMAAAGLPVVSTLMRPLYEVPQAVKVAETVDEFVEAVRTMSKRTRSAEAAAEADALCRAYDYEVQFARVYEHVAARAKDRELSTGDIDAVRGRFGDGCFAAMIRHLNIQPSEPVLQPPARQSVLASLARHAPRPLVRAVPQSVKSLLRRMM